MNRLLLILFFSMFGHFSQAQKLSFSISGLPDTTIYLCKYLGVNLFYADTAQMKNGLVEFNGFKHESGLYAVLMPDMKYFEVLHDREDVFIKASYAQDPMTTVEVIESESNKVFYQYVNYFNVRNTEINQLYYQMNFIDPNSEEYKYSLSRISTLKNEIAELQKSIVSKYKGYLIGDLIYLTQEMKLPDPPKDENGNITDSNYVYNYYIQHYWDGINLKDFRLVNTPVYHNKLNVFFSPQGLMQTPDTIIKYADILLNQMEQTNPNNRMFEYTLSHITYKYDTMQIVGMDKVFWYMTEYYYCPPNQKAFWMTPDNLQKVCYDNSRIENILIGNYAKPLILMDTSQTKWINFYDIQGNYTILYFWSPICDHCMVDTPLLQKLYDEKLKNRGVEVYGVTYAIGEDFDKWKQFIIDNKLTFTNVGITPNIYKQMITGDVSPLLNYTNMESLNYPNVYDIFSTPQVFVLDKDKKIVYKQITIYQLEMVIDDLTGHHGEPRILK